MINIEMGMFNFFFISFVHCSWTTHFLRFLEIVKQIYLFVLKIFRPFPSISFVFSLKDRSFLKLFVQSKIPTIFQNKFWKNRLFSKKLSLFQILLKNSFFLNFFSFFKDPFRLSMVHYFPWTLKFCLFSKILFIQNNDAYL